MDYKGLYQGLAYSRLSAFQPTKIRYDLLYLFTMLQKLILLLSAVKGTKLWRVVFKQNYESVFVLNCDNEIIVEEFPLLN